MKKLIMRMYGVAVILFFLLFLYGLMNLRLSIQRTEALRGYTEIINYSTSVTKDAAAPTGMKTTILFRLKGIADDYNSLFFLTRHQKVKVILNGQEIYSLDSGSGFFTPKSPGCVYNEVVLPKGVSGAQIEIELYPLYKSINSMPSFYLGARYEIIKYIIYSNLPVLLLCIAVIFIGIAQLYVAILNRRREDFGVQPAVCHALSIISVGIWKIFDSDFVALFEKDFPVFSQIPFIIMMLVPLMITKLVRDQMMVEKKTKIWLFSDCFGLSTIALLLVLQLAGIMDFWEGLWLVQASLAVSFVCIILSIWHAVKEVGWNKSNKTGAVVSCFAFVWILIDTFTYYFTSGVTAFPFNVVLFLIFLGILVANRLKISRHGMENGMHARQYKRLAYHDALTGFFNRTAYMDFLGSPEFDRDHSVIVAFDLNNLKKCNDELGHEKGDIYIKESAKIIMDCFGSQGRCYRLGGDEFGAILIGETLDSCGERYHRMLEKVDRFNEASRDIHMGIACGYATFDPKEDEDIHATIRRADKMMYEEKFRMKHMRG